ncbi:TetR/AcrR family transcriptional regulator [Weissella paramesenteroides]|uniref:TetR/AcrR family transcriptional regulator n=1 Tax=Weissella paramesenteroides TaxID=1249 RepID=UPI00103BD9FE|nr:TetR/AcrR family transcriptional regulator [Weissella paramesenteroides]MCM6764754.1 TetR/AcrR family transcriptional regulator [Weissella paramesenteroides]MCM6768136.1 TetR/AcrR family transcriptional regulator [Weissella paramesenteroides]MCM6768611.1 TetR/AcrR family transcriptional regulator [Weissella paramesenteroides]MCM6770691.1 TetR/AcrR family transcriptional regulator [Weissella paramesenteroides]MCM6780614.1 TetR/AcrR family transcriptional regulator [Weissella paramesenteroide
MANNISTLFSKSLDEMNISDKQKAVLQASLTLFSEKGFENTSTRDIARMANVAEGTVYKQFKTKQELLQAIVGSVINNVVPQIASEFVNETTDIEEPDFKNFLQNLIQNRMQFFITNLPQIRILIRESMTNKNLRLQVIEKFTHLHLKKLENYFKYYQQQGQLVDWDFTQIIRYILGTTGSYIMPLLFSGSTAFDITHSSQEATEFLMKGLQPK